MVDHRWLWFQVSGHMDLVIRAEGPDDEELIGAVIARAFADAAHADGSEPCIVRALREDGMLSVSLVAELDGEVVGHVAVSPVEISDGSLGWFGLGPLAVVPSCQGAGIGSGLVEAALDALKVLDAKGCVVLGEPGFYERFGFERVEGVVLDGVPHEFFMAMVLSGEAPAGEVRYHWAFQVGCG